MSHFPKQVLRLAVTGLLLVLLMGGVWLFNNRAVTPQTVQESPKPVVLDDQATQPPLPEASPPALIIIGTVEPPPTPIPTWTPWPTPTRRVEPTSTAIPIKQTQVSSIGYLLYSAPNSTNKSANDWFILSTNEAGEVVPDSNQRLAEVDSTLTYAQPSPSGKYILFTQPGMPGGIPYVYETQTKQTWPLFRNEKLFPEYNIERFDQILGLPFGWHPDEQQVLFWSSSGSYAGLWLVNVETSQRTVIRLIDGPPQGAVVSPDGQRIAFAINDGFSTHLEIASTDGNTPDVIPDVAVFSLLGWSPDGKWILFSGDASTAKNVQPDSSGNGPLWIMNSETYAPRSLQIPSITSWPFGASWSPDSRYVATAGLRPTTSFRCADKNLPADESDSCQYEGVNIYTEDIISGKTQQLATGIRPIWSPDGSKLAFLSMSNGNPELWTVRTDGSELQQVTKDGKWKWSYLAWVGLKKEEKQ